MPPGTSSVSGCICDTWPMIHFQWVHIHFVYETVQYTQQYIGAFTLRASNNGGDLCRRFHQLFPSPSHVR